MTAEKPNPKRGEIWSVSFDPTVGSEIRKTRPAVVVSADSLGRLPIKMIAPITGWNEAFARNLWHVRIVPDPENGLSKVSAVDTLQTRGVDVQRFVAHIGSVASATMDEIATAIATVIEFQADTATQP